jgi:hypothetical protein
MKQAAPEANVRMASPRPAGDCSTRPMSDLLPGTVKRDSAET